MSDQFSAGCGDDHVEQGASEQTPGQRVTIEVWVGVKGDPHFAQEAFNAPSIKTAKRLALSVHNRYREKMIFPSFLIRDESGVPIRATVRTKYSHVEFHDVDQHLRKPGPQHPLFFRDRMLGYGVPLAGRRTPGMAFLIGYEGPYLTTAVILKEDGSVERFESVDSIKNEFAIVPTHSLDKKVLAQITGYRFTSDEAIRADYDDEFFRDAFDKCFEIWASNIRTDPDHRYAALRRASKALRTTPPGIFRKQKSAAPKKVSPR